MKAAAFLMFFIFIVLIHRRIGIKHEKFGFYDDMLVESINDIIAKMQELIVLYVDTFYVHAMSKYSVSNKLKKPYKLINIQTVIRSQLEIIISNAIQCVVGMNKEITSNNQILVTSDICVRFHMSGQKNKNLFWQVLVRQEHMINLTINKGHMQHSINCNSDFFHINYHPDISRKYCGHVLFETLYVSHNLANIDVITLYTASWYLDVEYQVHMKGNAYKYHMINDETLEGIDFAFRPSIQVREGRMLIHQWYFNVPITADDTKGTHKGYTFSRYASGIPQEMGYMYNFVHTNKTTFVVDQFQCEDPVTWLSMESGLVPMSWMKRANKILSCASQVPFYHWMHLRYKHMTLMLTQTYSSQINIIMYFENYYKPSETRDEFEYLVGKQKVRIDAPSHTLKLSTKLTKTKDQINKKHNYIGFSIDALQYHGPHSHVDVSLIQNVAGHPKVREFKGKIFCSQYSMLDCSLQKGGGSIIMSCIRSYLSFTHRTCPAS